MRKKTWFIGRLPTNSKWLHFLIVHRVLNERNSESPLSNLWNPNSALPFLRLFRKYKSYNFIWINKAELFANKCRVYLMSKVNTLTTITFPVQYLHMYLSRGILIAHKASGLVIFEKTRNAWYRLLTCIRSIKQGVLTVIAWKVKWRAIRPFIQATAIPADKLPSYMMIIVVSDI